MTKIKSRLRNLLLRIAGEKYQDLVVIALAWNFVVGDILSERTKILKLENKILYVKVKTHIWMQQLVLIRPDILEKLRDKTKLQIENILFTL